MSLALRRLRTDLGGATAIEYAIVAGLIGLGLIGSLVATRGSLSAVFGTTSSRVASAEGDSSSEAQSAVAAYWSKKTISTTSVDANGMRTIHYTDGSQATIQTNRAAPYNTFLETRDYATNQSISYAWDANKLTTSYYVWTYKDIATNVVSTIERANAESFNAGVPVTTGKIVYDANGANPTTTISAPSQNYVNGIPVAQDTMRYFLDQNAALSAQGR